MIVTLWAITFVLMLVTATIWWFARTKYVESEWNIRLDSAPSLAAREVVAPPIELRLRQRLPEAMLIGESHLIALTGDSAPSSEAVFKAPRGVSVQVELCGEAFSVDRHRLQEHYIPEVGSQVGFRWSIMPKEPGDHDIAMIAHWIDDRGRDYEIDAKTHRVHVSRPRWLSLRRALRLSSLATLVSLLASVFGSVADWLGVFCH